MPLIPRFRRYSHPVQPAGPVSPATEIRFILARYDDGAIPPAILAVIERLRAEDRSYSPMAGPVDTATDEASTGA